jgi:hypothetical protein
MNRLLGLAVLVVATVGVAGNSRGDVFIAHMDGPSESPPNASPGIGFTEIDFDLVAHTLRVQVTFSGLLGTTIAAHIHAPTAVAGAGTTGVATELPLFTGFPTGVTSGSYDHTFDSSLASTYNPAFVTANGGSVAAAEVALFTALVDGKAYLNIHTTVVPGGEIRGFPHPVPEPASVALVGLGALGLIAVRRRRLHRSRG